jgi:hypothetical protein
VSRKAFGDDHRVAEERTDDHANPPAEGETPIGRKLRKSPHVGDMAKTSGLFGQRKNRAETISVYCPLRHLLDAIDKASK